jgi:virginiamycin A acetyltransferase
MTAREVAKAVARVTASIVIVPVLLSFHLRSVFLGRDRALEGSTQALALWPGVLGQYLRRAFLCRVLDFCSPTSTVEFGTVFSQTGARIGADAYIGPHCHIGLAHIGEDVLIAAGVHIPSGARTHEFRSTTIRIREQQYRRETVHIGAGAWIGSAAVIMADVGTGTVVGAGSVVTRPLPDNIVAAGVPARVVRDRESSAGTQV